ncbi:SDR family NAD(P)-dependent oxidoreductase [Mycobacterium sp. 050272]|uniref:SDR family NAD(P)-dependent oxidoreductase n=1 Tax=Mycobacterium sp. 050272 TaxID=3142488 RepID=UPI003185E8BB
MAHPSAGLQGKSALITGSTRGIGEKIAQRFAEAGAHVVITGRTESAGVATEERIRASGGDATFVAMDIGIEDDVARAVEGAVRAYGRLDILVNNAAPTDVVAGGDNDVATLSTDKLNAIIIPGLFGQFWACKYALPHLSRTGAGAIVNVSASSSLIGVPKAAGYSAVKGAMNALSRQIAVDFASAGVRSNTIITGPILTDKAQALLEANPEAAAAFASMLLTRPGRPVDIAEAALFLASDAAGFITGIELPVNGGLLATRNIPAVSQLQRN